MELTYVVIHTPDVETVRDWYQTHLGLEPDWDTADFVRLSGDGGAALGIHRGPTPERPGEIQLHFEVQDVDAEYDRLRDTVEFSDPPHDTDWGYRVTSTEDPIGHTVELYTPHTD